MEPYSGQVYALLTRFLGRRPGREDLVQEAFLRVIRARDRYQPTARFSTWLYRIVFNMSVNTRRSSSDHEYLEHGRPALSDPSPELLRSRTRRGTTSLRQEEPGANTPW